MIMAIKTMRIRVMGKTKSANENRIKQYCYFCGFKSSEWILS